MWRWVALQSYGMARESAYKGMGAFRTALKSNPDLTTILLMLLILYVSLLILTHVTKMMYAMVKNFARAMLFLLILSIVVWAANRGVAGMYSDSMAWWDSGSTKSYSSKSKRWW